MTKRMRYFAYAAALALALAPMGQAEEREPVANPDSPSGAAGDYSVQFKGVSSLSVDDPDGYLDITAGPITVEAWIKPDELRQYNGLISYGASYKLGINQSGGMNNLVFTFFGIVDIFSGFDVPVDGEWLHVAAVWTPGEGVLFYANGEEVASVAEAGNPRALQNTVLVVGGETNGAVPFIGSMDRVRIHNAALAAEDLDSVADAPKGPFDSTLTHYGFDEGKAPYASLGSAALSLRHLNPVGYEGTSSAQSWELYP